MQQFEESQQQYDDENEEDLSSFNQYPVEEVQPPAPSSSSR
jgi:hypothetical protein